ncbi:HEXXH motif domain-containing protein [Streptomyces sp. NBC_00878]|uniref:HEXXH motif domain-containing protein n=1 Tax=Streptomyces sp. NBC_00878 TaxID=2975854 RepID=UPI002256E5BD|nr:HEXXH motif domain-containing protein [Streptomyces sp. NBC_00878]MCX4906274.1 HEXXH motif domain-containing protein [Streptomyces sp. NBC_00878]
MRLHELSLPVLRALSSVTEDEDAVAFLVDAETSRRLLLLRMILDAGIEAAENDAEVVRSWRLLEAAEQADPVAFRAALLDPQVGVWAATLLRRLARPDIEAAPGEAPLRVELGFLGQLAAAVLIVAGADFRAAVPVRDGRVYLPGLGRATVGGDPWGTADVWARDGVVRVVAGGTTVTLPTETDGDAPGWDGLRRLSAERAGVTLTLWLDDLGPFAPVAALPAAGRLTAAQFDSWQHWFGRMWRVLVDDHPASARALAAGLRSVVPLPRGERLRARTASSSDSFGCVLLSEPDEDEAVLPAQLGVAVIHEFRHSLLNGLIFLAPLFDECGELFYAPWRDDPRPLGGLVHGVYAFSGVAHFWRTRGTEELAGFEFALWRSAVLSVLGTLHGHPALTPSGRAMVEALREQTAAWHEEPVGARELRLARLATVHHKAAWRVHHLRMPQEYAEELADAWSVGRRAEAGGRPEPELRADPQACRLDTLTVLARLSLVAPAEFDALRGAEDAVPEVPGAFAADLALVDGDPWTAVKLYTNELTAPGARPSAWAGLGLALSECGEQAAGEALTSRPEIARAVSQSMSVPPDPVALAHWLAR